MLSVLAYTLLTIRSESHCFTLQAEGVLIPFMG